MIIKPFIILYFIFLVCQVYKLRFNYDEEIPQFLF